MVGIPSDMDQMVLCDEDHAKENEMYKHSDFDLLNPNGTPIDAKNILAKSIKICRG